MKRIVLFLLTFVFLCTGAFTAFASEGIFAVFDLIKEWDENGYPDYFCGMWMEEDEHVIFGVVDGEVGEKGREEILSRVEPSVAEFRVQNYSYNELLTLQDELDTYLDEELGFLSTTLNVIENRVDLGLLSEKEGDPALLTFVEKMSGEYGDKIAFEYHEAFYYVTDSLLPGDTVTTGPVDGKNGEPDYTAAVVLVACFFCLTGMTVFFLRKGRRAVLAASGTVSSGFVTTKTVKEALREPPRLSDGLDQKVFSAVNEAKKQE